jgi:hypothetical protein
MESIITGDMFFKVFGLGFIAGGLFSFAVSMVADWLHEKQHRKSTLKLRV